MYNGIVHCNIKRYECKKKVNATLELISLPDLGSTEILVRATGLKVQFAGEKCLNSTLI